MLIRSICALLLLGCMILASGVPARADALDDALARFAADKFPESEKGIGELAASGAPEGSFAPVVIVAVNKVLLARMTVGVNVAVLPE